MSTGGNGPKTDDKSEGTRSGGVVRDVLVKATDEISNSGLGRAWDDEVRPALRETFAHGAAFARETVESINGGEGQMTHDEALAWGRETANEIDHSMASYGGPEAWRGYIASTSGYLAGAGAALFVGPGAAAVAGVTAQVVGGALAGVGQNKTDEQIVEDGGHDFKDAVVNVITKKVTGKILSDENPEEIAKAADEYEKLAGGSAPSEAEQAGSRMLEAWRKSVATEAAEDAEENPTFLNKIAENLKEQVSVDKTLERIEEKTVEPVVEGGVDTIAEQIEKHVGVGSDDAENSNDDENKGKQDSGGVGVTTGDNQRYEVGVSDDDGVGATNYGANSSAVGGADKQAEQERETMTVLGVGGSKSSSVKASPGEEEEEGDDDKEGDMTPADGTSNLGDSAGDGTNPFQSSSPVVGGDDIFEGTDGSPINQADDDEIGGMYNTTDNNDDENNFESQGFPSDEEAGGIAEDADDENAAAGAPTDLGTSDDMGNADDVNVQDPPVFGWSNGAGEVDGGASAEGGIRNGEDDGVGVISDSPSGGGGVYPTVDDADFTATGLQGISVGDIVVGPGGIKGVIQATDPSGDHTYYDFSGGDGGNLTITKNSGIDDEEGDDNFGSLSATDDGGGAASWQSTTSYDPPTEDFENYSQGESYEAPNNENASFQAPETTYDEEDGGGSLGQSTTSYEPPPEVESTQEESSYQAPNNEEVDATSYEAPDTSYDDGGDFGGDDFGGDAE